MKLKILRDSYYDSVTMMALSNKLKTKYKANELIILMGSEMNIELIKNIGFNIDELDNITPNDCIIAVDSKDDKALLEEIEKNLNSNFESYSSSNKVYKTQEELYQDKDINLTVISLPGRYAVKEAKTALFNNKHVMLFSDNITFEDEKILKDIAVKRNLLCMGPDCGTSIINSKGLCFSNKVNKGDISLIGASGTGLQEVTVLIHKLGGGIDNAIGVGGRDLSEQIGGTMTKFVLNSLIKREKTKTIVIVSKKPSTIIKDELIQIGKTTTKNIIYCFVSNDENYVEDNIVVTDNFYKAAEYAVKLNNGNINENNFIECNDFDINEIKKRMNENQKYIRGLFCGGTLCSQSFSILSKKLNNVYSNVSKDVKTTLKNNLVSEYHTILDMGDDYFTYGKPHPMIEPSIRVNRIIEEGKDKNVAVILLDFELGFGSHIDAVGETIGAINEVNEIAKKEGRYVQFIAYILGTDKDKQKLDYSIKRLTDCGVYVAITNEEAALKALDIVKE